MKKIYVSVLTLLVTLTLVACGSTNEKSKKTGTDTAKDAINKPQKGAVSFENNKLVTETAVVEYTGAEKGVDYEGKDILYTFFKVTNKTNEAKDVQMFLQSYVDFSQNLGDTTKRLDFGITMESPYRDKLDKLNEQLNPEGTVEVVYPSEIESTDKPVTLTFSDSMFGSKVGSLDIDL